MNIIMKKNKNNIYEKRSKHNRQGNRTIICDY